MIDQLVKFFAERAAGRKLNATAGHDITTQPGGTMLHHSTCRCGLGMRVLLTRTDWQALAAHPL